MLKRVMILMVTFALLLGTSVGWAEDNQEKATKDLLGCYQDMTYNTRAGLNRLDYNKEYRKLYVATQRNKSYLDTEISNDFSTVLDIYEDAQLIWENWYPNVAGKGKKYLDNKYPDIKTYMKSNIWGDYNTSDVLSFLWNKADNKIKTLEYKINNKYVKKSEDGK